MRMNAREISAIVGEAVTGSARSLCGQIGPCDSHGGDHHVCKAGQGVPVRGWMAVILNLRQLSSVSVACMGISVLLLVCFQLFYESASILINYTEGFVWG